MIAAAHIAPAQAQGDAAEPGGQGRAGRTEEAAQRGQAARAERWTSTDVRFQDRRRRHADHVPRPRLRARGAGRRRERRGRQHGQCRGADLGDACPTSTGPASTAMSAASWCVGPFQGRPACIRIKFGEGVCGVAAQTPQGPARRGRPRLPRPHRLRQRVEQRDRRPARSATASSSACSTSTARRPARFTGRRLSCGAASVIVIPRKRDPPIASG